MTSKPGRGSTSGARKSGPRKSSPSKSAPGKTGGAGVKKPTAKGPRKASPLSANRDLTVRLKDARRHKHSSQLWLERQLNDPYVAAARREGYRSRAAFKLIEIDDKHRLLKPGKRVIDLGAAPGGWAQVAAARVRSTEGEVARRGQVVAIDIDPMEPIAGAEILHLDFMDEAAPDRLKALLRDGFADIVLSDMAAPTTGHAATDHLRIMALGEAAGQFAAEVLAPGGAFLCKMFQGGTERVLLTMLKRDFAVVRHVKPPASRADSSELYVLATGFRGQRQDETTQD